MSTQHNSLSDIPLKLGVGQTQFYAHWCVCGAWLIVGELVFHAHIPSVRRMLLPLLFEVYASTILFSDVVRHRACKLG